MFRTHWFALMERLGVERGSAEREARRIEQLYSLPARHYHTLAHVADCFEHLLEADDTIRFALAYHDAIYWIGSKANEERSAAECLLGARRLRLPFGEECAALVRDTDHRNVPETARGEIIADVDMSILGREWPEFFEYERRIAQEFGTVYPWETYRQGRLAFLASVKGRIFHTQRYADLYEDRARENLATLHELLERQRTAW